MSLICFSPTNTPPINGTTPAVSVSTSLVSSASFCNGYIAVPSSDYKQPPLTSAEIPLVLAAVVGCWLTAHGFRQIIDMILDKYNR